MKISELKTRSEDPEFSRIIGCLYDFDTSSYPEIRSSNLFRDVIGAMPPSATVASACSKLFSVYLNYPCLWRCKTLLRDMMNISRIVFGDEEYFMEGTELEKRVQETRITPEEYEKRLSELNFLYDALKAHPNPNTKFDLVHLIAGMDFYHLFVEQKEEIQKNKFVAYIIASENIDPLVGTPEFDIEHQVIMTSLSKILYRDRKEWSKIDNIDLKHLYGCKGNEEIGSITETNIECQDEVPLDKGTNMFLKKLSPARLQYAVRNILLYDGRDFLEDSPRLIFQEAVQGVNVFDRVDEVLQKLVDELHLHPELYDDQKLVKKFRTVSKYLYDDPIKFAEGTVVEERCVKARQMQTERKKLIEDLSFLCEAFNMDPSDYKASKIASAAISSGLYPKFMENKDEIQIDAFTALRLATEHIVPLIGTEEFTERQQRFLESLSEILTGDREYWMDESIDKTLLFVEKENKNGDS